ncbi:MAG: RnfABCDGE type electron transport complex subunit A [Eubacteriales bacterium]
MMREFAAVFFTMILVDNYVLVKFLGICPFLGVSKKLDSAVGMSMAVTFVMVMATAATWPIQTFLLTPIDAATGELKWDLGYLQTVVFILIIATLVQLVEIILKKYLPALYRSLGVFLPLITTNCAILGVTILNLDSGYSFETSIVSAIGAGIGFLVAMVMFCGVRSRVDAAKPPKCFEGLPLTLVAASMVSMSFMGFGGIIEAIFGAT